MVEVVRAVDFDRWWFRPENKAPAFEGEETREITAKWAPLDATKEWASLKTKMYAEDDADDPSQMTE